MKTILMAGTRKAVELNLDETRFREQVVRYEGRVRKKRRY